MLSKQEILNNADSIFRYYLGNVVIGKYYNSPLRNDDTNASFNLYKHKGTLYFKDWGSGIYGNVIDFIMHLENCDFIDAIKTISNLNVIKIIKPLKEINNTEITISYLKNTKYTITDINYWRAINVNTNILKEENIISAKIVYINSMVYYASSVNNPIFLYPITCKNKTYYKIYIPYADKKLKFRNNYPNVSIFIHGLNTLKNKEYVIITKSVKDELVLKSLGYNVISTQGEDITIPKYIIRFLKQRYKQIYILYDCDYAKKQPYKFLEKHAKIHNLIPIYIPLSLQTTDVAEIVLKYGTKTLKNILWKYIKN